MTRALRVLIVDDSAANRRTIADVLREVGDIEIVGNAGDGEEALKLASSLKPDLITLDLEMPRMDGFTFLRLLMASRPTPVVVVSGHSAKENVFRALELGAIDFIAKPEQPLSAGSESVRKQLVRMVEMVRQLAPTSLRSRRVSMAPAALEAPRPSEDRGPLSPVPERLIVIGASTGGPTALLELFSQLPSDGNYAVVVAQHMPERFTKTFAERLDRQSAFRVREAEHVHEVMASSAFVCPGGRSAEVDARDGKLLVRVLFPASGERYAPSADRLFESAARAMGDRVIAVIMTGMGEDGARGAVEVKKAGGTVLVESEETAVVYGMPRAALKTGKVDAELPLPELVRRVLKLAEGRGG
jgi:two-component system chemotaxis response regulator CheB